MPLLMKIYGIQMRRQLDVQTTSYCVVISGKRYETASLRKKDGFKKSPGIDLCGFWKARLSVIAYKSAKFPTRDSRLMTDAVP